MDKILIIDFGSQVTQLIARRVRASGVYCEIFPYNKPLENVKNYGAKGIILSGGPSSVSTANSPKLPFKIEDINNVPILGICYGQQYIANELGGQVESSDKREFGKAELNLKAESKLLQGVSKTTTVWMSHGDKVEKLPEGFKIIADTNECPYAAIANEDKDIYGVQFHPEVTHSEEGEKLLSNFVLNIANATPDWQMDNFIEQKSKEIAELVGDKNVICGVSGGVDSSVVAVLLHKVLGDQVKCIFVDHGLLRKNEAEDVVAIFESVGVPLTKVDASEEFFSKLAGINDPEKKRKIIGGLFIDIFEREANAVGNADFLAQGTLYPDVIESVSVHGDAAVTIKSHHNVGGLPERMNLSLIEPLRELFKDEVRELGAELGLPKKMLGRHPFPGPGLAIRVLGEITEDKVKVLQEADFIYTESLREDNLYDEIWQAFAVLLPVKTVGVMGDARTYENVCSLRAVTSKDGMTADFYEFPVGFLGKVARRIVNNVKGVNRVVYDYTSKPPGTIEWE